MPKSALESKKAAAPRRRLANDLNDLTGKQWIRFTKTWFVCDSRRYHRNKATELHPARFPEEMVAEFLRFFTKAGAWVLDPFCGSGATLVAAREEERNAAGIELSPDYVQVVERRLAELDGGTQAFVVAGDARQVASRELWQGTPLAGEELPQFDFMITSPPYWDMLHHPRGGVKSQHQERIEEGLDQVYSEQAGDLGNITDYDQFVEEVGSLFDHCYKLLRPGKYLVVVAQNLRTPEGEIAPLAWDLARRIGRTFSFQGERIWCQDSKRLGIWGYPKIFVPNYHHHYCLIFQKQ